MAITKRIRRAKQAYLIDGVKKLIFVDQEGVKSSVAVHGFIYRLPCPDRLVIRSGIL